MISMHDIRKIVSTIVEHVQPDKVILFGSYAAGNPTVNSDVDLLVVKEMAEPRYQRGRVIRKFLRGIKIPVDLVVYSQAEIDQWKNVEAAFITQAVKNGQVLYG